MSPVEEEGCGYTGQKHSIPTETTRYHVEDQYEIYQHFSQEIYVVEATAYRNALQLKHLPVACQLSWPEVQLRPDTEFNIELRDGQGILNVDAFHCQQEETSRVSLLRAFRLPSVHGICHPLWQRNRVP